MPSALASEDLLAHVGDLAGTGRPRRLAALGPWTAVAARTDEPGGRAERIVDPGDVQYLRQHAEGLRSLLWDTRLAAAVQALAQDRAHRGRAVDAVGLERRRQIDPHREYVRVTGHVAHADRVTAIEE